MSKIHPRTLGLSHGNPKELKSTKKINIEYNYCHIKLNFSTKPEHLSVYSHHPNLQEHNQNTMNTHILYKLILIIGLFLSLPGTGQVRMTGFEGLADESVFNAASWTAQGFSTRFVNGFDVNRAKIDNAYAVSGSNSLRILYPSGNYGPVTTGSGAQAPLILTPANQYYASYWVRFADNFTWGTTSYGGKLPGLAGGGNCSGCSVCTGSNGFSARLMWRTGGRLVLYLYHLDKINPPCGDNYTLQQNGSDYYITKGQWFKITERVKVNTGTNHDGEVELWINDQPALLKTGIQFVSNGDKVDNFYFSTFHGGNDATWAPTSDTYTWFDDLRIGTNAGDFFTPLTVTETPSNHQESPAAAPTIQVYPQPVAAEGSLSLTLPKNKEMPSAIEWHDMTGKQVYTSTGKLDPTNIPVPKTLNGVYLLKLVFWDEVYTVKVLIE
ncbi:MAG: T9SS type A sorting domain-containing protein [Cytophagales bacterium]|nr:T9SS type A sorting domain-containing protein [Cytophagales bacterium]